MHFKLRIYTIQTKHLHSQKKGTKAVTGAVPFVSKGYLLVP